MKNNFVCPTELDSFAAVTVFLSIFQFHLETNIRHDRRRTDLIQRESDSQTEYPRRQTTWRVKSQICPSANWHLTCCEHHFQFSALLNSVVPLVTACRL